MPHTVPRSEGDVSAGHLGPPLSFMPNADDATCGGCSRPILPHEPHLIAVSLAAGRHPYHMRCAERLQPLAEHSVREILDRWWSARHSSLRGTGLGPQMGGGGTVLRDTVNLCLCTANRAARAWHPRPVGPVGQVLPWGASTWCPVHRYYALQSKAIGAQQRAGSYQLRHFTAGDGSAERGRIDRKWRVADGRWVEVDAFERDPRLAAVMGALGILLRIAAVEDPERFGRYV